MKQKGGMPNIFVSIEDFFERIWFQLFGASLFGNTKQLGGYYCATSKSVKQKNKTLKHKTLKH
jgi:hypothetical protein